jgi:hypothetical protein
LLLFNNGFLYTSVKQLNNGYNDLKSRGKITAFLYTLRAGIPSLPTPQTPTLVVSRETKYKFSTNAKWKHQFLGHACESCYFTQYDFFTCKQVGYRHMILCAHRKTSNTVAVVPLFVRTHVSLRLESSLIRQDQMMCSSTPGVLQDMSYKPLVNQVS